jgi:hypothetical protein
MEILERFQSKGLLIMSAYRTLRCESHFWLQVTWDTAPTHYEVNALSCSEIEVDVEVANVGQSASLSRCRAPIWNSWPDFSFLPDKFGFLEVGHPLWWEDGSVIYSFNCFWAFTGQSLGGSSPAELGPYFTLSLRLPQPGEPGPRIYIPQEQGGPIIPTGTGFCSEVGTAFINMVGAIR